jgi:hypothetical protein
MTTLHSNGIVIEPNGTIRLIDNLDLETMQEAVGGYIERVNQKELPGCDIWVNEEGIRLGLEQNIPASALVDSVQTLLGNALITSVADMKARESGNNYD